MKKRSVVLYILSGLLLLPWPMAAFSLMFLFDAPIHSKFDETLRYAFAGSVLAYPVVWIVSLILGLIATKQKWAQALINLIVLAPYICLLAVSLIFTLLGTV